MKIWMIESTFQVIRIVNCPLSYVMVRFSLGSKASEVRLEGFYGHGISLGGQWDSRRIYGVRATTL